MNCDDVFDRITSGGADAESDPAVEAHLARCARCRSLVEALEPALELFREAEIEEGAAAGEAFAPSPDGVAGRGAARRGFRGEPLSSKGSEGISHGTLLRMAAAVVLGVALGGALPGWGRLDAGRETAPVIGARSDVLPDGDGNLGRSQAAGLADAGALGIAAACLERALPGFGADPVPAAAPTQVAMADLACCSNCHSSLVGHIEHGAAALSKVAQSCAMCHN